MPAQPVPRRVTPAARFLFIVALILGTVGAATVHPPTAAAGHPPTTHASDPDVAYVDVAAATLWTEPGLDRAVDAPATGNPVDLRRWTDGLSISERLWLVGKLETQALYGTKVTVLERSDGWVHVAVAGQPTPRNELGYPGWLPADQLTTDGHFGRLAQRPFALVTATLTALYTDPARRHRLLPVALDTRLPVLGRAGRSILVATPEGRRAWLPARDATVYHSAAEIPRPSEADLVRTAKRFTGLPYVWAGTSSWGFDCSGFTHTVYDVHGVTIPRDADAQFAAGTPVAKEDMRPGDLIFYAHASGYIHHVGMYLGDGYEIDAPNNTSSEISTVEVVKVDEHRYADEYAGSRRFL
ncbi:MAG: NlpC/P60 family protein [Actinocatenispora sp.]